jgi:Holliday junction resolvasome RuvABC DNA-binding subunit
MTKSASAKASADEAENALVALGFTKQQAKDALSNLPSDIKDTEARIKLALKTLGK